MSAKSFSTLVGACWAAMLVGIASPICLADTYVVYMAPDGSDSNSGLDEDHPVLSLARTHQILYDNLRYSHQDAEVRIAHGTYYNQTVVWTFTMPAHSIKFTRWPDGPTAEDRPVFSGGETWFRLNAGGGQYTNLIFHYLRVEYYMTAIDFDGCIDCAQWDGNNTVYGCYFYKIGGLWTGLESFACLRLENSRDNLIRNNHFVRVQNHVQGDVLHAIYLAHFSSNNLIVSNRFKTCMGDPVRVRDAANWNRIAENRFIGCGQHAAVSEWFSPSKGEASSWENRVYRNTLDGMYGCDANLSAWYIKTPDVIVDNCTPGGSRRFRTWGNVQTDEPCSSE